MAEPVLLGRQPEPDRTFQRVKGLERDGRALLPLTFDLKQAIFRSNVD